MQKGIALVSISPDSLFVCLFSQLELVFGSCKEAILL
jgi:hypothetical protein